MGKKKLARFRELSTFDRVIQPPFEEVFRSDFRLKGKWAGELFKNDRPLVLELGCGKGEYTVGLARKNPGINYMGLDIKGARIWTGARTAYDEGMKNVAFLRTRIDFVSSFFTRDEVDEIWITFPDPQEKLRRRKKRQLQIKRKERVLQARKKINAFDGIRVKNPRFWKTFQKYVLNKRRRNIRPHSVRNTEGAL